MAPHPFADRLVYALDVNFDDCKGFKEIYAKAAEGLDRTLDALKGTGVTIKGNSVFRVLGAMALMTVASAGCFIFADYKLFDVQSTIANDTSWLKHVPNLKILTVAEAVHPKVFANLSTMLPDVIVAPVNPLTDLSDAEFKRRGEVSRDFATTAFFNRAIELPAKGIICSPKDISKMTDAFRSSRKIITPGIRPSWSVVEGDTNALNALTHQDAIRAGADILVVGTPLRFKNDLRNNTLRILDETGETVQSMH